MSFPDKRTLRLLVVLEERGIGRPELGSKTGLTPEEVDRIIDQGQMPGPEVRRRIADALQVSEEYFFGSEEQVEAFLKSQRHWQIVNARFKGSEEVSKDRSDNQGETG